MKMSKFIGIPWKENGRSFSGVDCYGLLYLIYKEKFNILIDQHHEKTRNEYENNSLQDWICIKHGEEKEGDVILFEERDGGLHVAIVVKKGLIIHSRTNKPVCIERYDRLIRNKSKIYRHRKLHDE